MAVYSHQKKANKHARRLLPALGMLVLLGGVFALLAGASFFTRPVPVGGDEPSSPPSEQQPSAPPTAEPAATPPPARVKVYSLRTWPNGLTLYPDPELMIWGVDTIPQEAESRRCRFAAGNGSLLLEYGWGDLVPESQPVEDDFFSDTVFIGNSLEQGFMIYSGLTTADMFATQSITVSNIFYEKAVNAGDGEYITILDAVARKSYRKVYIMLGLNEISYRAADFTRQYGRLLDKLRELQPEAELYLQSMTPVTARQSESGSVFNNERIREYNELIRALAGEKKAHYLHVFDSLADEDGALPAGSSFDGIHPYGKYYKQWYDYLKSHTVVEVKK